MATRLKVTKAWMAFDGDFPYLSTISPREHESIQKFMWIMEGEANLTEKEALRRFKLLRGYTVQQIEIRAVKRKIGG